MFLIAVLLAECEFTAFAADMPALLTILLPIVLIGVGICTLFLPLLNIHNKMIREREQFRTRNLGDMLEIVNADDPHKETTVSDLTQILLLEHQSEQITAIPSWPFDTSVIRSLAAVVFAVVASTSAHMIVVFLGI